MFNPILNYFILLAPPTPGTNVPISIASNTFQHLSQMMEIPQIPVDPWIKNLWDAPGQNTNMPPPQSMPKYGDRSTTPDSWGMSQQHQVSSMVPPHVHTNLPTDEFGSIGTYRNIGFGHGMQSVGNMNLSPGSNSDSMYCDCDKLDLKPYK